MGTGTRMTRELTFKRSLSTGVGAALLAWVAYATVEALFEVVALRFLPLYCTNKALPWNFTLQLLGLYSAAGVILGALAGTVLWAAAKSIRFIRETASSRMFAAVGALTLVAAVGLALVVQFGPTDVPPTLVTYVSVIAMILALSLVFPRLADRLAFATNPWTISLILVGIPWLMKQFETDRPRLRVAIGLMFSGAVLIAGLTAQWIRSRPQHRTDPKWPAMRFAAVAALVVVLASFAVDRKLYPSTPVIRAASMTAPNVILVTMDTVRADHLSVYGYERDTTPNLRKLAEDATLYTRAIAPSDVTLSTHGSMFTGLYPTWHGAHTVEPGSQLANAMAFPLSDKHVTLAERLQARGYSTAQVVANYWFLGPSWQLHQGFDYYSILAPSCCLPSPYLLWQHAQGDFIALTRNARKFSLARHVNQEIFGLLDRWKDRGQPFFLFADYMDAHWPYVPPEPFDTKYPGKDPTFRQTRFKALERAVTQGKREPTEAEQSHLVSQYDGALAYLDSQIGELIAKLKNLDLYDNTLIMLTSDHGEALGERSVFLHNGVPLYQNVLHVPLIIKYPKARARGVVDDFVSTIDVMPTVLDVVGAESPKDIQGKSLLQRSAVARPLYAESYPRMDIIMRENPDRQRVERAVFDGNLKYITSTVGKHELYDLLQDPAERTNLYRADDPTSQRLRALLEDWLKQAKTGKNVPVTVDREAVEKLRSLGYIR
jgi:arylsulfatase A-like enzyme